MGKLYLQTEFIQRTTQTTFVMIIQKFSSRPPPRPLSRRSDRCDRMIQNESRDSNGGNVCLFSVATSLRANAHVSSLFYTFRESLDSVSLDWFLNRHEIGHFLENIGPDLCLKGIKAKMLAISSDTHQLQLIKLHHFKLERFKSI